MAYQDSYDDYMKRRQQAYSEQQHKKAFEAYHDKKRKEYQNKPAR
jgi:hypothetical protein